MNLADVLPPVAPLDTEAMAACRAHLDALAKPAGSLGRLEDLAVHLAGIAGQAPPPMPEPVDVVVFAGDHGVVASGVTPWPQAVTAAMVGTFARGGAAVSVLAGRIGARVSVVDVGVATPLPPDVAGVVVDRKVAPGTSDLSRGPAMTIEQAVSALAVGVEVARERIAAGCRLLVPGDMGIGNTTAAACLVAAFTGLPAVSVTGRGTGIDDAMLAHKAQVVEAAVAGLGDLGTPSAPRGSAPADPLGVLAAVGGLEIAAMAGAMVAAAAARIPVVVDGVIAGAALLAAEDLVPGTVAYAVAGHRSTEPGASALLGHLGLEPVLDLGMRLGEGSGACLAAGVVLAAAAVTRDMATLADAVGAPPEPA